MQQNILYVGLDVDDTQYHCSAFNQDTGEALDFKCRPILKGLTIVQPPDEVQEQDRDLLRSRQKLMQQRTQLRKHLQAVLRRNGLHYKAETGNKSHWTKHHYGWLEHTIGGKSGSLKAILELLLAGKHPNWVKVACAREMMGFVWESPSKVAA